MIGNRLTQSFGMKPAAQVSSRKPDQNNYVSAEQKAKMGEQTVGDTLNQIANPNWVDPAKMRQVGKNKLDKDDFLKLMLTQMKYQDPTTPLESHEMAAQLAQFTSLEQMQNMNSNIEKLVKAKEPGQQYAALQLLGKSIESDSGKILRTEGDASHELRFQVPKPVKDLSLHIKDEDGNKVRSYKLSDIKEGNSSIEWNGLNSDDKPARPGNYTVEIEALDDKEQKVAVTTKIAGVITGVNYTAQGPMLMLGKQSIPMSDVRKISDPSTGPVQSTEVQDLSKQALKLEQDPKDTGTVAAASQQILKEVPMERGLLNRVKEAKE